MDKSATQAPRKPYTPPLLTVYGTVRDLTQKVGPIHTGDGGKFPKNRTSLH
jgi:hypothetical protein